jgi:ABC-2 type transport system ATP-binding protein
MDSNVIETFGLTRSFGAVHAVKDIDLRVPQGSIYGFLGPNGAGKTTTIRMLIGLIKPSAGKVMVFGSPLEGNNRGILSRVGSLVETPSLYPHLSGRENLELIRRMVGAPTENINYALELVQMQKDANRLVKTYSMGMRQRMGLALAYLLKPELLILDEPTNGLDPSGIHEIRDLICRLPKEYGVTVFVSSHLLNEVEQMATQIGIISQGHLIFQGTPEQLRASYHDELVVSTDNISNSINILNQNGWNVVYNGNHHLNIRVNGLADAALINKQLVEHGVRVYQLNMDQPSLEDIFLTLTEQQERG